MYPIVLKIDSSKDTAYHVKQTKEQLKKVPNAGLGYGLLKYTAKDDALNSVEALPEISFNYLGQFEHDFGGVGITISDIPLGPFISPNARRLFPININAYVKEGCLNILVDYSSLDFKKETIDTFVTRYKNYLTVLIDYCVGVEPELTPSDLTYSSFEIEELEDFLNEVAAGLADEEY
jgi:non-ribosomal peptide synthase protein (TIGR01720 family)